MPITASSPTVTPLAMAALCHTTARLPRRTPPPNLGVAGDEAVLADVGVVAHVHVGAYLGATPHDGVADGAALDHGLRGHVHVVFEDHPAELGERHEAVALVALVAHARAADRSQGLDAHVVAGHGVPDPGAAVVDRQGGRRVGVDGRAVGGQVGEVAPSTRAMARRGRRQTTTTRADVCSPDSAAVGSPDSAAACRSGSRAACASGSAASGAQISREP